MTSSAVAGFSAQVSPHLPATGNQVWSPSSAYLALSMAMLGAGAGDESHLASLRRLLSLPPSDDNGPIAALNARMRELEGDEQFQLLCANAIFADPEPPLRPEFLERVREVLDGSAEVRSLVMETPEACAEVNKWVREKTHGMIAGIMEEEHNSSRRAVIVNAIYMKGGWVHPFLEESTRPGPFHAEHGDVQAQFMHDGEYSARYLEDGRLQAVFLPYRLACKPRSVEMLVVLPRAGEGQCSWAEVGEVGELRRRAQRQDVNLTLPRFRVETKLEMTTVLRAAGMQPGSFQLSCSEKRVCVDSIVHKAVITVDEAGTEASAATGMLFSDGFSSQKPPAFTANRPFLFAVYDSHADTLLFQGRLATP